MMHSLRNEIELGHGTDMKVTTEMRRQLEQVFLYPTLECSSQCISCYMYEHYSNPREVPFQKAREYIKKYRSWGVKKLTLLGGEPTSYLHLPRLIKYARDIGYSYIRIQTNGQFDSMGFTLSSMLENIDTFSFSIDGHTENLNRRIRQGCSLNKILENMKLVKQLGCDVRTNITVTSINIDHILDIINFAENNGASVVYLNIIFSMGAASKHSFLNVSSKQWISVFNEIKKNSHKFRATVKLPMGYAFHEPHDHRCIAFRIKRLYVMPNGDAYPCILFIHQPKLQLDSCSYSDKLALYTNVPREEMDRYCRFLPINEKGVKPLCLYYKKVFGRGCNDTQYGSKEKNTPVKNHSYT